MSVSTAPAALPAAATRPAATAAWLLNRRWDLTFITLSVFLAPLPYLAYLGFLQLQPLITSAAAALNTTPDDLSRNMVNAIVAILVGIPHTFATFTRTRFDKDYTRQHRAMIRMSIIPPIVVIVLALVQLPLLLTLFFFWASIHTMHQIIFITELYHHRQGRAPGKFSRMVDYALILIALYPVAAWRLANGNFVIGLHDISAEVQNIVGLVGIRLGPWMIWVAGGVFALVLGTWIVKSAIEWRQGRLHGPRALFILMWTTVAFFAPSLSNLDSAFQGLNIWHSTQYLALTWMLNNLRQRRGELDDQPFLKRLSVDGSARKFYLFNIGLMAANIVVAVVIFFVLRRVAGQSFDYALDRAYYIGILSFLWIHYFHDHFLFVEPDVIDYDPALAPASA